MNFDRALTAGDPRNRIHFNLGPGQADPDNEFRLVMDTIINSQDQLFTVFWNDTEVMAGGTLDGVNETFSTIFKASEVAAVEGENIVTIEGVISGGWIGFDFISADILSNLSNEILTRFVVDQRVISPGGTAVLSWEVTSGAEVTLDQGIGSVTDQTTDGRGSITVSPTETTSYTLSATLGGKTESATLQMLVRVLSDFSATPTLIEPGGTSVLSWAVNPNASVEIDQGIGNVDNLTVDGVGSLEVSPAEVTTYTITASLGNQAERANATVSIDFGFNALWIVGQDNGNNSEFTQESAAQDPPGSPFEKDDDYYFAGDYGGDIGNLESDEDSLNFDRALTTGDPRNRIHFILTEEQAQESNLFKVTLDTIGNEGSHPFTVLWNDNPVYSDQTAGVNAPFIGVFSGADAGAVPGQNTVMIERGGEGGWIQFDFISMDVSLNFLVLAITEAVLDSETGGFKLSWKSETGKKYTIQTSENLVEWSNLAVDYPQGGATSAVTSFVDPQVSTPSRYYRILQVPAQPIFSEDFESGAPGWNAGVRGFANGTKWELGTPTNGPGAAHSGENVYGTDLDADYEFNTDIVLRSPVIDLTDVRAATLRYFSYRDVEPLFAGLLVDYVEINVLDTNLMPLTTDPIQRTEGVSKSWRQRRVKLPEEALGKRVILEFGFVSDDFNAFDDVAGVEFTQAGWFIDDVEVVPE